jgi:hypothetical protein
MRYGDELVLQERFCDAVKQYQNASAIAGLDADATKGYNKAFQGCYPATATPTITGIPPTPTNTGEVPPTKKTPPTKPPTDTPTQESTPDPNTTPSP